MHNSNQLLLFCTPKFNKKDKVIYSSRTQDHGVPYSIEDIREEQGFVEYKVNNKWWRESNLLLFTYEVSKKFERTY